MQTTEPTRNSSGRDLPAVTQLTLLQTPRSASRRIAGVCGGLAQRWNVDPLLIRVAAVLLLLSSGIGAVLYGAGWMLMPAKPNTRAPIEHVFPGANRWSRTRVVWSVVIASIVVALLVGKFTPGGALPLVILVAVWFFARRRKARQMSAAAPPSTVEAQQPWGYGAWSAADASHPQSATPTEFDLAVQAWQQRLHHVAVTQDSAPMSFATAHAAPTQTPSGRRPSPSWGRGLGLLGIATGVFLFVLLFFGSNNGSNPFLVPASLALGVIAVGLLVSSRVGRPRLAVAGGLVFSLIVVASIAVPFQPIVPTVSSTTVDSMAELPAEGIVVEGQVLELDLSDFSWEPGSDVTLEITVHKGLLDMTLPDDYNIVIQYTMNGGLLDLPDEGYMGTATGTWTSESRDGPTLTLLLDIDHGTVGVS